ncbi:hypothetical protein [Desulfotalea psychrophila]|uniref:Hypothetical membrane protein, probably cold-shock inducible n=1 Tax=Desulfotalea psychrophila (strain LSv54 / DSM 12343) TaxID=177439 RepID=Q6ALJ4_DESPS|nr:hypothetical protein [Desulfotalea psychrophila]CAG36781.1 hypothetical membrane protein, probably cold-shock inducible [Desulfotalea psychrophila LSv54]
MSNIYQRDLIISLLAKNYDTHMNIIWATIGLLLGAIGWIITSREARSYLTSPKLNKIVSLVVIIAMAIMHYYLLWQTMEYSIDLKSELIKVVGENVDVINTSEFIYLISYYMFSARAFVTFILFGFLSFLVIKGEKHITSR